MKIKKQIIKISVFAIIAIAGMAGCATAQTGVFNQLNVNSNIRFKGHTITGISNDSTFASPDSLSIPTVYAVYNYFKNHALTSITTNHPYVVSDESAMLALSAIVGDVAVRTDESKSYILQTLPASTLSNWIYMPSPIPSTTDLLSEGSTNKYYTDSRVLSYITGKNISIFNNDLNFTKRSELVDSLAKKEPVITAGGSTQYWAGDKTWKDMPDSVSNYAQMSDSTGFFGKNNSGDTLYAFHFLTREQFDAMKVIVTANGHLNNVDTTISSGHNLVFHLNIYDENDAYKYVRSLVSYDDGLTWTAGSVNTLVFDGSHNTGMINSSFFIYQSQKIKYAVAKSYDELSTAPIFSSIYNITMP